MSLLLIYPPFAHPRAPHLAIPTLAGYLKAQGLAVSALDANLEFFHYFLTEANIDRGRRYAAERLVGLNQQEVLSTREKEKYLGFATLLQSCQDLALSWEAIFGPEADQDPMFREEAFRFAAVLAAAPYEPEDLTLLGAIPSVQYNTPFDPFSTRDILNGAAQEGLLSGFYEKILPPVLDKIRPRVVGLSIAVSDQVIPAFRCARIVKKLAPQVHVTIGGSFVSAAMRKVENPEIFQAIDSLILDDGEIPLEKLLGELNSEQPDLSRVPSLHYLMNGRIERNSAAKPLSLEDLPIPDFKVLPFDRYLMPSQAMLLPFRSSRGCYWKKCNFCRTEAPVVADYSQASAEYIFESLKAISRDTGVNLFAFTDESSAPAQMEKLSRRLISENLALGWSTCFRLEKNLTHERCRVMAEAGLSSVNFGLEVYNDRLLKLLNKGTDTDTILTVLNNTTRAGIFSFAYMMVGLPTEIEAEAILSFRNVRRLQEHGYLGDFSYSFFQLYRDSNFYCRAGEYGLTNISPPHNQDLEGPISNFDSPGMSRETAERLSRMFNMPEVPVLDQEVPLPGRTITLQHDLGRIIMEDRCL